MRVLLPPNSRSTREGRLPQEDGRLPFNKGSPDKSMLERAGKAPACAHAAGKEPIGHQKWRNESDCASSIASMLVRMTVKSLCRRSSTAELECCLK